MNDDPARCGSARVEHQLDAALRQSFAEQANAASPPSASLTA
jgi:hypothetical protein